MMGTETVVWRSRIGLFNLSNRSARLRNKRQPLSTDYGHAFIPGITRLILAFCFAPVTTQPTVCDQPWSATHQQILNSTCSQGTMQVNTTSYEHNTVLYDSPSLAYQWSTLQTEFINTAPPGGTAPLLFSFYPPSQLIGNKAAHIHYGNRDSSNHEASPIPSRLGGDLPSGLKVTQWNLQSIAPRRNNTKLEEIKLILQDPGKETHILGVTETWLDSNFKHSHIKIKGYVHERSDREEKTLPLEKDGAGGVVMYIEKNIPYIRRKDLESNDTETIWIQLCPPNHPPHLICTAYRSPDYSLPVWIE